MPSRPFQPGRPGRSRAAVVVGIEPGAEVLVEDVPADLLDDHDAGTAVVGPVRGRGVPRSVQTMLALGPASLTSPVAREVTVDREGLLLLAGGAHERGFPARPGADPGAHRWANRRAAP